MQRLLLVAALAVGGVVGASGTASAQHQRWGPYSTSVTWPCVTPPGWYTNTYNYAWYYPWYAYYNYSQGPYANWMAGGGYATYGNCGPGGHYYSYKEPTQPYFGVWYRGEGGDIGPGAPVPTSTPTPVPSSSDDKKPSDKKDDKKIEKTEGRVSITLPADAKLLFNGTAAPGTGTVRTFRTPALQPGQNYRYELTAEVVRNGRTERATETVMVRAGETATVTLAPTGVQTAGAK